MLTFEGNAILGANDIVKKLVVREYFQNAVSGYAFCFDFNSQLETLTTFWYSSIAVWSTVACLHDLNC